MQTLNNEQVEKRAQLVMRDNGELRAVMKDDESFTIHLDQVGQSLTFTAMGKLGDAMVLRVVGNGFPLRTE